MSLLKDIDVFNILCRNVKISDVLNIMEEIMDSTTTPSDLQEMISLLESVRTDYNKFYTSGNQAAGTRVRKAMQTLKNTAQNVRVHVQATKNAR